VLEDATMARLQMGRIEIGRQEVVWLEMGRVEMARPEVVWPESRRVEMGSMSTSLVPKPHWIWKQSSSCGSRRY